MLCLIFCFLVTFVFLVCILYHMLTFPGYYMKNDKEYNDKNLYILDYDKKQSLALYICGGSINQDSKVLVFCHGNGQCLGDEEYREYLLDLHLFLESKYIILSFDYPGYHKLSTGVPSETSCNRSLQIVYNWLVATSKVSAKNIHLVGFSLGSGPVVDIFTTIPLANPIILLAPFISVIDVKIDTVRHQYLDFLNMFKNIDKLNRYSKDNADESSLKTVIIHGFDDNIVPIQHSDKLYYVCSKFSQYHKISNCGHNDMLYNEEVIDLIKQCINTANAHQ